MKYEKQEILVDQFELTDLDMDYYYSEKLDDNGDQIRINILESDQVKFSQTQPAKIGEVIEGLTMLKNNGAERVYIAEHTDHHGYYFYGVKLEPYIPSKIKVWVCIKSFPGSNKDDVYRYDPYFERYHIGDNTSNYTSFKDFDKFPEFFEQKEIKE